MGTLAPTCLSSQKFWSVGIPTSWMMLHKTIREVGQLGQGSSKEQLDLGVSQNGVPIIRIIVFWSLYWHYNSRPKALTILTVRPKFKEITYDWFKAGAASPTSHLLHENFRAHPTQKRGLHNTYRKRFHLVLARGILRLLMLSATASGGSKPAIYFAKKGGSGTDAGLYMALLAKL